MKVIDHINQSTKPSFSYEILPPKKGDNIRQVFDIISKIKPLNPAWINVTSHASSLIYKEDINGKISKKIHKKRHGTIGICGVIQNKFAIDAVAHLLCQGFSKEETENTLIELNYLGIENVLALKGDNLNYNKEIVKEKSINTYSKDLVTQINNMQKGQFLDETEYEPLKFCIGVAGYPEKHIEAPNMEADIHYLKQKVDAGAEYIITQMFFDNSKYYAFVNACKAHGINVPIIPGLKLIKSIKQVQSIPKLFNIDLPHDLVTELHKYPDSGIEIGKTWATVQIQDLLKNNFNNLHFFLMNDVEHIVDIIQTF